MYETSQQHFMAREYINREIAVSLLSALALYALIALGYFFGSGSHASFELRFHVSTPDPKGSSGENP